MVEDPIVPQNLSFSSSTGQPINADLKGLNALQDLQKIVTAAGQAGLKVILDDHRSEAGESAEQDGLWYTGTYTSQDWVNDWTTLGKMFAGNPTVIGFDLRNEPHTPAGDTYAQGATWGTGDATTDVRLAYEQAGNARAVSWAFPGGQQLSSDWSGVFTQSGANVTVANEPYNGSISPGSSVTIGFTASGTAPSSLSITC
jgi:aryl-phospho-beta-D-glucosidase BglC (GH1 family)